jgi:hypothetical protein
MAEVFAGYVEYTDDQVGRVLDFLESSGELDNTIIVVVSDNGASGEGGPNGTFNEWRFFNGVPDTTELTLEHIDELGTPASYNHYNTGWAWAFDTPFPYWKRWAGYEGGIADMCLVSWPAKDPATHRAPQYVHAVDVVPTIYDLIGITPPETLGATSSADRGRELRGVPHRPGAPASDAVLRDARPARDLPRRLARLHRAPAAERLGQLRQDEWELYHLEVDRSQSTNLAAAEPERLEAMVACGSSYAEQYNGLPLDDRSAWSRCSPSAPAARPPADRYVYYPDCADVPEQSAVAFSGRALVHDLGRRPRRRPTPRACSSPGGVAGGHSLYVQDGGCTTRSTGSAPPADGRRRPGHDPGAHVITAEFVAEGRSEDPMMPGARGTLTLYVDDEAVGSDDDRHPAGRVLPGR